MTNVTPRLTKENKRIITEVNEALAPFEIEVTGLGPPAVAVLGDARAVGVSVVVGPVVDAEDRVHVATTTINKVRGVARVLMDIPTDTKNITEK